MCTPTIYYFLISTFYFLLTTNYSLFILGSEHKRYCKSAQKCGCYTACGCCKSACEYPDKAVTFNGFSYAISKKMSETCKRYCCTCACKIC